MSARHTTRLEDTLLLYYYCFILHLSRMVFFYLWVFKHRNEDNMENLRLFWWCGAATAATVSPARN